MKRRQFLKRTLTVAGLTATGVSPRSSLLATLEPTKILILPGTNLPLPSYFTRMFPHLARPRSTLNSTLEQGLIELGSNMKDDPNTRPDPKRAPPMAGYTYLGQFIDHDLTLDLTPLRLAGKLSVKTTPNFRSARLDLDHLYGGGPELSPFLYEIKDAPGNKRFLIGQTRPSKVNNQAFDPSLNDLPRNVNGTALVGDPRQDENLIIAQLHVAFLKLHNRFLANLEQGKIASVGPEEATPFEQARRLLTWHYQWVVRYDFLQQVLDPAVFDQLSEEEGDSSPEDEGDFRIPVEFSVGAFRFGHSMVRDEYFINDTHMEVSLKDLFKLTGTGGGACPSLPADWVLAWERFFFVGAGSGSVRHSRAIDTRIARSLHELPTDLPRRFREAPVPTSTFAVEHPDLPVRTLLRGARVGLPSGQDVARALGFDALRPDQVAEGPDKKILTKYGYDRDTPLWYYILKEAELFSKGQHLGPTGSKLVAQVIMAALLRDPGSYLSVDRSWIPTLPAKSPDPKSFEMADLLRFIHRTT